jgi:hypothetical protein
MRDVRRVPMIGVATQRRPRGRPRGRRPGHPRDRTVGQDRRAAAASTAASAMAANGRHRTQAQRRRTGHPGRPPSPARLHLRGPLAALCRPPPAPPVPLPAPPGWLQQAPAPGGWAVAPCHPGCRHRHQPVDRRRLAGRLHPGGVWPLAGDHQALGAGRVGPIRLLRQPFALVLGAAAAPGPRRHAHRSAWWRRRPVDAQQRVAKTICSLWDGQPRRCPPKSSPGWPPAWPI